MGGCGSRPKEKKNSFSEEEKKKLHGVYAKISTPGDNPDLNSGPFVNLFFENLAFGKKLYNFMKVYSDNKPIAYDTFEDIAEILIKDYFEGFKEEYSAFDKMEMLALITLGQKIKKKEELHNLDLAFIDAIQFVKDFLLMFSLERINIQLDEANILSLLNSIFEKNTATIKWGKFLMVLKEQLYFLNNLIKGYFSHKLLETLPSFKLPTLSHPSYLLNNEGLSLLYLSNSFLQTAKKLKLIYSSTADGWNYDNFYQTLVGYKGSTLLLFRHDENLDFAYDKTSQSKSYVFGIFQYMAWGDVTQNLKGSEETYFFSLSPEFRNFPSKKNYEENHAKQFSVILNSIQENVYGIGLGKVNEGKYRLWIDKFLNERSYWAAKDEIFENGNLLDPYIQKFNIRLVEVWGFENSKELNYHHILGYTNTVLEKPQELNDLKQEIIPTSSPEKILMDTEFESEIKRYLEKVQTEEKKN